jgi:hypothetical protein
VCQVCGKNTRALLDASGSGSCAACPRGTHNPNPAKYRNCVCKIGHQPDHAARGGGDDTSSALTCSPCPVGYYKLQTASGAGALRFCISVRLPSPLRRLAIAAR